MLEFFRNFFKSPWGIGLTLGMVGLIALAFAAADVGSSLSSGGIGAGATVANVGKNTVTTADLVKQSRQAVEGARRDNPKATMKDFLAAGGLGQVLNQLIDRVALEVYGQSHGVVAGKRLVDSELNKAPVFQGADGKFSETAYRQFLSQRGLSDKEIHEDIAQGMIARQLVSPAGLGAGAPAGVVARYAELLKQHRSGLVALLPSAAFAPKAPASDADVAAWYAAHKSAYMLPETRVIRVARFGDEVAAKVAAPSDAEISARYEADKAKYAASETRKVSQLIVADEASAKAIVAAASGSSLEAAAKAKGLSVASLGSVSREQLAGQASAAAADAVFGARKGAVLAPAKVMLGYAVLRVDAIDAHPGKSLAQAKGEIAAELTADKRKKALGDITAKIDEQFNKGGALSDAAKDLGIKPEEMGPLTAQGQFFAKPGQSAPKELARTIQAAFAMDREGQPQIAELVPGKQFVIFDVVKITPAAPAPLAAIKQQIVTEIALDKGQKAALAAGQKLLAATKKGTPLAAAVAAAANGLPAPQAVDMDRAQVDAMGARVPQPIELMFSMAAGTTKLLPIAGNRGYFVVQLKSVTPGAVAANDPVLPAVAGELAQISSRELGEQLRQAIRNEVGVKRHDATLKAVAGQLAGAAN